MRKPITTLLLLNVMTLGCGPVKDFLGLTKEIKRNCTLENAMPEVNPQFDLKFESTYKESTPVGESNCYVIDSISKSVLAAGTGVTHNSCNVTYTLSKVEVSPTGKFEFEFGQNLSAEYDQSLSDYDGRSFSISNCTIDENTVEKVVLEDNDSSEQFDDASQDYR